MYSCPETTCKWFTSSLSVSKSHFSFRKHEPNKNKHRGDRGSLRVEGRRPPRRPKTEVLDRNKNDSSYQSIKVTVQFETEGICQNEIVVHMDRSQVKL